MISFQNVSFAYGNSPTIFSDLSFAIQPGSFQFLAGPSGSGKTSLLRLLMGQHLSVGGEIKIFNENIAKLNNSNLAKLRRRIGIVFQEYKLLNHLNIYENVALPLIIAGKANFKKDIIELLEWVGLKHCIDKYPPVLSGGEQQRAAIARALINQPELLLADEPTGNLDPELAKRLLNLFIELNKSGTCVVLATHDENLINQYKARCLRLQQGKVIIHE